MTNLWPHIADNEAEHLSWRPQQTNEDKLICPLCVLVRGEKLLDVGRLCDYQNPQMVHICVGGRLCACVCVCVCVCKYSMHDLLMPAVLWRQQEHLVGYSIRYLLFCLTVVLSFCSWNSAVCALYAYVCARMYLRQYMHTLARSFHIWYIKHEHSYSCRYWRSQNCNITIIISILRTPEMTSVDIIILNKMILLYTNQPRTPEQVQLEFIIVHVREHMYAFHLGLCLHRVACQQTDQ